MGGRGSGRPPSIATILKQQIPAPVPLGDGLQLPNVAAIKPEALRVSSVDITAGGGTGTDSFASLSGSYGSQFATSGSTVDYSLLATSGSATISLGTHINNFPIHVPATQFATSGSVHVTMFGVESSVFATSGSSGGADSFASLSGSYGSQFATSGSLSSHTADSDIHQSASVFATSGSLTTHTDDTDIHQSASVFATSGSLSSHTGDSDIHQSASVFATSGSTVDYSLLATSGSVHATMRGVESSVFATSGSLSTHESDSTDPHGSTLTQTGLTVTTLSGSSGAITSDADASGSAIIRNVVIGTEDPNTASVYTQGTIYLKYTA